jgi:hypothetical protein
MLLLVVSPQGVLGLLDRIGTRLLRRNAEPA